MQSKVRARVRRLGKNGRYALLPLGAILVVVASYAFTALSGTHARPALSVSSAVQDPITEPEPPALGTAIGAVDTSDTDRRIAFWQHRIQANPNSDSQYQYLGELLVQKGRETGDVSNYQLADTAFRKATALFPGNMGARADLAVNLVTLHQWDAAIAEGKAILEARRTAVGAVAVIGDASLEIGDLDTAQAAFDTLKRLTPSPAVTIRLARLAFLQGHTDQAIALADDAASAAASLNASAEEQAFDHYSAGEYRWNRGDLDAADSEYQAALKDFPSYYLALAGRGRVAFAHGDLDGAISFYRAAVAIIPKPEMLAYLGDLYALKGDQSNAEKQYQQVDFIVKLNEIQAQVFNREIALFQATHHRDTAHAVAIATAELATRKDIYGYDAYAWALYADGQASKALAAAQKATALGTQDPKLLYHLGMIELAIGRASDGRAHLKAALALNPDFDPLGARAAREALGSQSSGGWRRGASPPTSEGTS